MDTETAHPVLGNERPVSGAALVSCLRAHGAAKLAGFFDPSLIAWILEQFRTSMAERQKQWDAGMLPREHHKDFTGGSMRLDQVTIDGRTAGEALTREPLQAAADEMLGHSARRSHSSYIRTISPGPEELPFHQDQTLVESALLNIWLPLTPCGTDAPGLEVALTPKTELLATTGPQESNRLVERKQITRELIVDTFGERALWHPTFEPGDALVFSGSTVHRTYVTEAMTEPRTSIELRLI